MRIGINAYPLVGQYAGIGVYIYNIIKYLAKIDNKNEYILYSNHNIKLPFKFNPRWHISIITGPLTKSCTLWMQTQARKKLIQDRIDLFWATNAILPLNIPVTIKTVLTVHDLTWLYYPNTINWDNRIIFPLFFKKSIKRADKIIAISKTTAEAIEEFVSEVNHKVSIVYAGVDITHCNSFNKLEARNYIASKFDTCLKYILTVATLEPRKNLDSLLRAYAILIKNNPQFDHQLLIVGRKGWKYRNIYKSYDKLGLSEKQVKFLGYILDTEDMVKLYYGAEMFILPSLYEGFGLPPLEAMTCGTPVVASDIPVFREVLDDSALLVGLHNPEEIANGIYRVLTDNILAQ